MLSPEDLLQSHSKTYKNEQNSTNLVHKLTSVCCLMDLIKPFELELQRKHLLVTTANSSQHPIWFLAETEMNVFLWRSGKSIEIKDEFEFWIDPQRLISKRLSQLELKSENNPFIGEVWSDGPYDRDQLEYEKCYLTNFLKHFEQARKHLHALSQVRQILEKELVDNSPKLKTVVLPAFFKQH